VNSLIKSSIAAKAIVAAINFLILILSARYLGSTGRGEIAFFITVLATVQLFTEIINGPTIVYLSTRLPIRKKVMISFLWAFFISAISYIIFKQLHFKDSLLLAVASFQFSTASIMLMILQGNNRIGLYNFLLILQSLILISLFLLLIFLPDKDYHAFVYAFLASWNITFLIGFYYVMKASASEQIFPESYKETFLIMFKKGIVSQSGNIIAFLNYRLIFYIIAFTIDKATLGIVSTGFIVIESILMIGNGLGTIQYPAISTSSDPLFPKKITRKYLIISFWLSLLCLIIINCIPAYLYSMIFGKDFSELKIIFLILSPGVLLLNLQNTICFYFNGLGLYMINTLGSFVGLLTFIILAASGYKFGLMGLCLSVSLSYIVLFAYMFLRFIKHSNSVVKNNR
jgi:O-antigen/teichoic acid export membrane protein